MKTNTIIKTVTLLLVVSFVYSSCKKVEEIIPKPESYAAATENASLDNAFAGTWRQVSKVCSDSSSVRSGSPIVTITQVGAGVFPKLITIDYGTTNVLCSDGVNRRGIIKATLTGRFSDSATVIVILLTDYYHNDYNVKGTQNIVNKGHVGSSGELLFNQIVNDGSITNNSGANTTWKTTQDLVWTNGSLTPTDYTDDVFTISGTVSTGTASSGDQFTLTTTTNMEINATCGWITTGKFILVETKYPEFPITFDYGSGTCDASAEVKFDGTTSTVTMN